MGPRIVRGALGTGGVQAASRLMSLVLGIVLARALGAEGYGTYAYAFALMNLLMVAAEAGVPTLVMREVAASQGLARWGELRGALVRAGQFVVIVGILVSAAGFLVLCLVDEGMARPQWRTLAVMLLVLPLAGLVKTVSYGMRGLDRVIAGMALERVVRPALVIPALAVVFLALPEWRRPEVAMAAQLLGAAVALVVGAWGLYRFLPPVVRSAAPAFRSWSWLKSALPFTLIGGAGVIHSEADVVMLGWFRPADEVGVYRIAVQGAMLVPFGLQVVSSVLSPHLARLYAQGDRERLQRLVTLGARAVSLVALPVALAFVLAGGAIAAWVFGADFAASHTPLAILAIAQLVVSVFGLPGPLLSMAGYESRVSRAMWVSALANIGLNLALIPLFGLVGAALATGTTVASWNVYLFFLARRSVSISAAPWARAVPRGSVER